MELELISPAAGYEIVQVAGLVFRRKRQSLPEASMTPANGLSEEATEHTPLNGTITASAAEEPGQPMDTGVDEVGEGLAAHFSPVASVAAAADQPQPIVEQQQPVEGQEPVETAEDGIRKEEYKQQAQELLSTLPASAAENLRLASLCANLAVRPSTYLSAAVVGTPQLDLLAEQ